MDTATWGAEEGVLRGFLIREEGFDSEQLQEFFQHRSQRQDASRWKILRWMGVPQERTVELRSSWREVGPLVNLLHREIHGLPADTARFTWRLLCDGLTSAAAMRNALRQHKQYSREGLKTTPVQILVTGDHMAPAAFLEQIARDGHVILECADCQGRSWLIDYSPEETYICDGCMGTLDALRTVDRLVAQMVDNDHLVAITPKEIIGDFEVGEPLVSDPTGQLYQDSECEQQLIKLLSSTAQQQKEVLREYRMFLGQLRQLDDPHLIPALRLTSDEDRLYLVFEAPVGLPLVGHPAPPGEADALQVILSLSRGLAAVHRAGLVHGSVRPANVWIPDDEIPACLIAAGEALQPGLSALPDDIFLPGDLASRKDVSIRSDLYGMGVLMVWLISGKLPDPGNPSLALKVIDPKQAKIVSRLLLPDDPYPRTKDLLIDLRALLGEKSSRSRGSDSGRPRRQTSRHAEPKRSTASRKPSASRNPETDDSSGRSPAIWIGLGLLVLTLITLGLLMYTGEQSGSDAKTVSDGSSKDQTAPSAPPEKNTKQPGEQARRAQLLEAAKEPLSLGNLTEAQAKVRAAASPSNPEGLLWNLLLRRLSLDALIDVLEACARDRQWDDLGERAASRLREKAPERLERLATSAKALAEASQDRPQEQIIALSLYILLKPKTHSAYRRRGLAYDQLKLRDLALADYNTILKMYPKEWMALNNRALIWREQGLWDKALADHNRAIANVDQASKHYRMAIINRGVTYLLAGKTGKALQDLSDVAGTTKLAYAHLILALAQIAGGKNQEQALATVIRFLRMKPGSLFAEGFLADRSHITFCTQIIQLLPKHPLPLAERATMHLRHGDKRAAAKDLEQGLTLCLGAHTEYLGLLRELLARTR